ncbi:MAG: hypothetical protein WCO68_02485 [Verrucomicrobiota bacterium]
MDRIKSTVIALFLLFAVNVLAAPESVSRSQSPDKHYRVSVEQTDGRIEYRIDAVAGGEALFRLTSSYQPEKGEEDWAYKQSLDAEVHWRNDSRVVAIEEANYRRMGTVLIARRTADGFSPIPVSAQFLMQATHEPWDRGRLFFTGWGNADSAILYLGGRLYYQTEKRFEESGWRFEIDLAQGGKILQQKKGRNSLP